MRSSIDVLSGPPAKSGKTWTVSRLHGLEALEWTRVSCTLRPRPVGSLPPRSWSPSDLGRAVPSGRRTMPDEDDGPERAGLGEAEAMFVNEEDLERIGG